MKKIIKNYGLYFAWMISLVATLGSLFASEVLGLKPCPFCWYQRVFMFPLAIILGLAAYHRNKSIISYIILLPVIGAFIALIQSLVSFFHLSASFCGNECIQGNVKLFGFLDLSILSFLGFAAIFLLLLYTKKFEFEKTKKRKK
ncbi:MAG: disulfide bond formation protein B [Parachlamydiales bacterium]|jgi:disulfide bond formation protein DsbB